jgi:hypothetical protein
MRFLPSVQFVPLWPGDVRPLASVGAARALLVQSAWSILRAQSSTDPLKRWGDHIAQTRGKKIAVVSLANSPASCGPCCATDVLLTARSKPKRVRVVCASRPREPQIARVSSSTRRRNFGAPRVRVALFGNPAQASPRRTYRRRLAGDQSQVSRDVRMTDLPGAPQPSGICAFEHARVTPVSGAGWTSVPCPNRRSPPRDLPGSSSSSATGSSQSACRALLGAQVPAPGTTARLGRDHRTDRANDPGESDMKPSTHRAH